MVGKEMRNVDACLYGQVHLRRVYPIFPVALFGDVVAIHAVPMWPQDRKEVTNKRWRAEPPTMLLSLPLKPTG